MTQNRETSERDMRARIFSGSRLLLDGLSKTELEALQPMLLQGEAEIINEACRPYVVRKLPRR